MVEKVKKIPRTLYFSPEIDRILHERAAIMDRTISAETERLIRKALAAEQESDLKALPPD